jgi:hypothetical protein
MLSLEAVSISSAPVVAPGVIFAQLNAGRARFSSS